MTDPIRIANCSGFFGDRLSGAREMVEGGPIDVLTGDWLAELTMLILSRIRAKKPGGGFASTFVRQMDDVMGTCLDRGIKVVSNAGGLDPAGCAEAVQEVADRLGLSPTIAYVDGDDLLPRIDELAAADALQPFDRGRRTRRPQQVPHRQRLPRLLGHRRGVASAAPTSSSPVASPTPPSCAGRLHGITAGLATTGINWPGPSSPVT